MAGAVPLLASKADNPRLRLWVLLGACLLVFSPFFVQLFTQLADQSHLAHFPLTILLAAALLYRGHQDLEPEAVQVSARRYGCGLLAAGFVAFVAACWMRSAWIGVVAGLICVWGVVDLMGGRATRRALRPGWIMLFAVLPPPFGSDQTIIIQLQKIASRMASNWLDVLGIANVVSGVVVRTPQRDFLVEEACSGVNSMFASLTLALFWVLWQRYRLLRSVLFLVSCVGWVLLINAFRVWAIVSAEIRLGRDLTAEPQHTVLGLVVFAVIILAALCTDYLLNFILPAKRHDPTVEDYSGSTTPRPAREWPRGWIGGGLLVGVSLCGIAAVSMLAPSGGNAMAANNNADPSLMPEMSRSVLPEQFGAWQLMDFEQIRRDPSNPFGMLSQAWVYKDSDLPIVISLDGPYESWHDLGYCYGALDWQLRDSDNLNLASLADQTPIPCAELTLYKSDPEPRQAVVMFTSFDSTGAVIPPPAAHGTLLRRISNRLGLTSAGSAGGGAPVRPPVYQVQLYAETPGALDPTQRASLDQLYDHARRVIAERIAAAPAN